MTPSTAEKQAAMSPLLFAKKSMNAMLAEANEKGADTLERVLGPVQLDRARDWRGDRRGNLCAERARCEDGGPFADAGVCVESGLGCAFAGLCYAEFAAMIPLAGSAYTYAYATLGELIAWIIGWDLTLEYAMGASTVSSGWSNNFVEMLNIFHLKFPLWLAYDHWTGLRTATDTVARQMVLAANPGMVPGTPSFSDAMDALKRSAIRPRLSPALMRC